jgi:hypothetical protein
VRKGVASADPLSTVTTQELSTAYVHFCEERGWNPLPTRKLESALPDALLEVHRASKRNDVLRDAKNQRGYRGVRLVAAPPLERKEEDSDASPFG